ncbi:MAG: hypothetical protein OXU31_04075 [Gammaproteobacteria bacterium]|nr:hypothetical protein [Gammaproteobacteria bacterium]
MKNLTVLVITTMLILSGCTNHAQEKADWWTAELNRAIADRGTTEQVLQWLGPPTRQHRIGSTEVWEYNWSLGTVTRPGTITANLRFSTMLPQTYSVRQGQSYQQYEWLRLTFKNGVLVNHEVRVLY